MEFHKIEMKGELTVEKLSSSPSWGSSDEARIYYDSTNKRLVVGDDSGWSDIARKDYVDTYVQGVDWQESVLDRIPIGSAVTTTGNRYIATATGGGWTANNIYEYNGSSWDEAVASEGFSTWVEDEDVQYVYNGSAWVKFGSTVTHANLNSVGSGDDHPQYAYLSGRSGGQGIIGGTASGNDLNLYSTSHATKGNINIGQNSTYDDVNHRLGISRTPSYTLDVNGSIRLSSGSAVNAIYDEDLMTSDDASGLATQQSIKAYVDSQIGGSSSDKISEGDSYVEVVDGMGGIIQFNVDSGFRTSITSSGIQLESGVRINEFSTDNTLSGDSNTVVPTEQAVKTYVDNQVGLDYIRADIADTVTASTTWTDNNAIRLGTSPDFDIYHDGTVNWLQSLNGIIRLANGVEKMIDAIPDGAVELYHDNVKMLETTASGVNINGSTAWHAGNDGHTSGLDADTIDGSHGSAFAAAGHTHSYYTAGDTIRIADGTIAAPGLEFNSDTNLGIYRIGDDNMGFAAAGARRMDLTSEGLLLGIGTRVKEFSTDTGLSGDSDTAVPTEAAVKSYVDANAGYSSGDTILAAVGSEAAPSYSFSGDTDTGIYSQGGAQLAFTVGNNRVSYYSNQICYFSEAIQANSADQNHLFYVTEDADHRCGISILGNSVNPKIQFLFEDGGVTRAWLMDHNKFYPNTGLNKTFDLGGSTLAFDDVYADDFQNVADFYILDDRDDLAALHQIKGNGVIDEATGFEVFDDSTMPEWIKSKYSKDIEARYEVETDENGNDIEGTEQLAEPERKQGETMVDDDGRNYLSIKAFTSLLMGAIKQLDNRVQEERDTANTRIAELESKIAELETI